MTDEQPKYFDMRSELCKTCIHTKVCMKDKNLVGDVYVAPHPVFFDEEYKRKSWEDFKEREAKGFPCDDYINADDFPKPAELRPIEDDYIEVKISINGGEPITTRLKPLYGEIDMQTGEVTIRKPEWREPHE